MSLELKPREVDRKMVRFNVSSVIAVKRGKPVGIITGRNVSTGPPEAFRT